MIDYLKMLYREHTVVVVILVSFFIVVPFAVYFTDEGTCYTKSFTNGKEAMAWAKVWFPSWFPNDANHVQIAGDSSSGLAIVRFDLPVERLIECSRFCNAEEGVDYVLTTMCGVDWWDSQKIKTKLDNHGMGLYSFESTGKLELRQWFFCFEGTSAYMWMIPKSLDSRMDR